MIKVTADAVMIQLVKDNEVHLILYQTIFLM